jgi:hypothetical protein|tara:strand:- start:1423 stop:1635 length:213 start_codon:yes stop_codon:yes gene_type:complete
MQSKKHSLIESVSNIVAGLTINIMAQLIIYPFFNINITLTSNFKIAAIFTVISLMRSYLIRRLFTKRTEL